MPQASTTTLETQASLTGVVNKIKPHFGYLRGLLFPPSRQQSVFEELIEIDFIHDTNETAPLVAVGAAGKFVTGPTTSRQNLGFPNIRIKKGFTPDLFMGTRLPGLRVFNAPAAVVAARRQQLQREIESMRRKVDNTREYLVSQLLRGVITYSTKDHDNWTVTLPRSASNDVTNTSTRAWDGGATVDILDDIRSTKRTMGQEGLTPDICFLGSNAAAAFINDANVKALLVTDKNPLYTITTDGLTLMNDFAHAKPTYLGSLLGVRFFEYSAQVTLSPNDGGGTWDFIRPDYAVFIHTGEAAGFTEYYAQPWDMDTVFAPKNTAGKIYSKTWRTDEDTSSQMVLMHCRPLPMIKNPDATFSRKVANI